MLVLSALQGIKSIVPRWSMNSNAHAHTTEHCPLTYTAALLVCKNFCIALFLTGHTIHCVLFQPRLLPTVSRNMTFSCTRVARREEEVKRREEERRREGRKEETMCTRLSMDESEKKEEEEGGRPVRDGSRSR